MTVGLKCNCAALKLVAPLLYCHIDCLQPEPVDMVLLIGSPTPRNCSVVPSSFHPCLDSSVEIITDGRGGSSGLATNERDTHQFSSWPASSDKWHGLKDAKGTCSCEKDTPELNKNPALPRELQTKQNLYAPKIAAPQGNEPLIYTKGDQWQTAVPTFSSVRTIEGTVVTQLRPRKPRIWPN